MAKLDLIEKLYIKKIAALSKKDKDAVRDVMLAFVKLCTIDLYAGKKEIIIPYVCKLKVNTEYVEINGKKEEKVILEAEPARAFLEEFFAIREGRETPSERYLMRQIDKKLQDLLKLAVTDPNIKQQFEDF